MGKQEAISYLNQFYEKNMWFKEEYKTKLIELIEEKDLSLASVKDIFSRNSAMLEREKSFFAGGLSRITMSNEYYRLKEVLYPVGRKTTLCLRTRYIKQRISGDFKIVIFPYYDYDYKAMEKTPLFTCEATASNNQILFDYVFDHEDRYLICVLWHLDEKDYVFFKSCVYALEDDLYGNQFFKADLHMHTTYSDGFEEPDLVAASARECGMDIIAVTDHNDFYGSVAAKQYAREMGLDMTVILGEEYAMTYSPMHILALGTEKPVSRDFIHGKLLASEKVQKIINESPDLKCDPAAYACTQVLLEEVDRQGGISILAHPYWKPIPRGGNRMDTPESLFKELAKNRRFHGVEIVSGSRNGECNVSNLQASLVREMLGNRFDFPIIGITDSHNYSTDDICGKHFTIIISENKEAETVLNALRAGRCVAVEMVGSTPLSYGSHRLSKLADFLVKYYFPERDRKAKNEAQRVKEQYLYNNDDV